MGSGAEIFNSVINQGGTPAMLSNTLALRPAFGYRGRIFIATDTREIYRDTGISWELIGSGGGSVNIYNSNGTLTGNRLVNTAGNSLTFSDVLNGTQLIYQNTGGYSTLTVNTNTGSGSGSYISSANSFTGALSTFSDTGSLFGINRQGYTSINHSVGNGILFGTINNTNINIGTNNILRGAITSTGRFLFGTLTDAGFLADFNGTLRVNNTITQQQTGFSGSLTISHNANSTHRINNIATGNYLQFGPTNSIRSEADFIVNSNYDLYANRRIIMLSGNEFRIDQFFPGNDTKAGFNLFSTYNNIGAGGTNTAFFGNIIPSFVNATTGTYNLITLRNRPTYNFTNGTNNAIGYLYDPVLTSLTGFDHIAIQTNSGRVDNYDRLDLPTSNFSDRNAWTLHARLRQTLTPGADQAGAGYYVGGLHIREISASGNNTFGNATINAGGASTLQIDFTSAGTLTASQSGLRAFSGHQIFNTFGGSASGTITHFAGMQILGLYNRNSGSITPTITNAYGLIINNLNDYSHTFTLTNRWGIYQTGGSDNNYLAGKLLVGTTTVTARQVHISGNIELTTTLSGTAGGNSGQHLSIWANGNEYKIALLNP